MTKAGFRIAIIFVLLSIRVLSFSQTTPESLKTAMVYRIANCVVWNENAPSVFTIGVLSNNKVLIQKFKELSEVAQINKKDIQIKTFANINSIEDVQLLYVDQSYNQDFPAVQNKFSKQNAVLISEEYSRVGEIMFNLKLNTKKSTYTFEYNRANILFAGLDITDEIILLKGSEIQIRELYLQAKTLWDEQQTVLTDLKKQNDKLSTGIRNTNDSILKMKRVIDGNQLKISEQLLLIAQKDSLSELLNDKINKQEAELNINVVQTQELIKERNAAEELISFNRETINQQVHLSDSLNVQIEKNKQILNDQRASLSEKETLIQKQMGWILFLSVITLIVIVSIVIITRIYFINKLANQKIADQKEELQKQADELIIVNRNLEQFAYVASHDLQEPLRTISNYIQIIEEDYVPQLDMTAYNYLNFVKDASTRMSSLIRSLLEFSRLGINLKLVEVNCNDVVADVLADLGTLIKTTNAIVKVDQLTTMLLYETELRQLFQNLISNAIKFRKKDIPVKIHIRSENRDGVSVFSVSDNGIGIASAHFEKIFNIFQRIHSNEKEYEGKGIGLANCKKIVQMHKGNIWVESELGIGSTFYFTLQNSKI